MTVDQLKQEVLKLAASDRARLAEWIASSLDAEAEVERAWPDPPEPPHGRGGAPSVPEPHTCSACVEIPA